MAKRLSHTATIQEEVIRALLSNAPAVMDIAAQLDIAPREVRSILQETLLQFGDPMPHAGDTIPITAHTPSEYAHLNAGELRMLFANTRRHG